MNQQHKEENLLQYKDCLPANEGYYVADCACERCRKGLLNPHGDSALTSIVISAQRFLCHNCYEEVQAAVRREKERRDAALRAAINAHYDAEREKERKERKKKWKDYLTKAMGEASRRHKKNHKKKKKGKRR